jgi:DNA replication protein DnaC
VSSRTARDERATLQPIAATADAEPRYFCARCEDEGFIYLDPEHTWSGGPTADCECKKQRQAALRAQVVARPISKNWRGYGFDRLGTDLPAPVVRKLRKYAAYYLNHLRDHGEPPPRGLWIVGLTGTIKTGAAAAVAQEIGRKLYAVDARRWDREWKHSWLGWWPLNKLLRELRATQGDDAEVSERQLHQALADVQLLVLDDLVAPRISPFASESLYGVLDARYEAGLPTMITTNKIDETQLEDVIGAEDKERGESIVRRIRERCIRVEFPERPREYAELPADVDESVLAPERDPFDDFEDYGETGYGQRPTA